MVKRSEGVGQNAPIFIQQKQVGIGRDAANARDLCATSLAQGQNALLMLGVCSENEFVIIATRQNASLQQVWWASSNIMAQHQILNCSDVDVCPHTAGFENVT